MAADLPGFFEGTEMPTAGWWEALWPDPAGVIAAVAVKPDMEVIDLCSGDGWFTLHIARIARHVVAIDIDPSLLDVARHRLREGVRSIATLWRATPTTLPNWCRNLPISCSWQTPSTASLSGCASPVQ